MKNKKRLKIGIFIDIYYPSIDGVVVVVDNLAKMLSKYNDVTVVAPYTGDSSEDYKKPYDIIRIKSIDVPFTEYWLGLPRVKVNKEYKELLKKDFDIIHIHSPFTIGRLGVKLAQRMNIPCINTVHTQYEYEVKRIARSKQITKQVMKLITSFFNKCDECIVVNDPLIKELKNAGYKNKLKVIYNGTDLTPIRNKEKALKMVNKLYDLNDNDTVLLFVGRLISTKNIYFLLKSLKLLKDEMNFKMLFVGTGPEEKRLRNKIKEYDMEDCVNITGEISNRELLSSVYTRADLLLLPSVIDTSSLVRIEAAINGTPGVFIKDTMVATTIKDNFNGFTAELDETKYKDRIKEIINDKKLLKKVSKSAQETLGKTWYDAAEETYEEYLKLIKNKG